MTHYSVNTLLETLTVSSQQPPHRQLLGPPKLHLTQVEQAPIPQLLLHGTFLNP